MFVSGINVVRELLNSNSKIIKIFVEETDNKNILELAEIARQRKLPVEILNKKDFNQLTNAKSQGIVAKIADYKYYSVEDILQDSVDKNEPPFIVILDGITDPHNLGAIIRTCECAGVNGVIIPANRACEITDTVYKTSAGAICHIKIAMVTNLTTTIKNLQKNGIWVYGLEAGENCIYNEDFKYPTAIVVGSEGKGISRLVLDTVDKVISLDMYGKVNSLNASNAAAIAVYEVVKQRRK